MSRSLFSRSALAASLSIAALATPAFAKTKPIVIPASVFAKPESKLCMARAALAPVTDKATLKTMPATICDTKAGWEARGLEFKLK